MKKNLTTILMLIAMFAISCGGGSSEGKKSGMKVKSPEKIAKLNPDEFANDVNEIYVGAFKNLEKLLDKYPEINADFEAEFDAMYEDAIKKMIVYGGVMDKMDQETDNKYSLKIAAKTMGDGMSKITPVQQKFNERINEFSNELFSKVQSMNTMLRFLDFDKMKSKHANEAEKYGIK